MLSNAYFLRKFRFDTAENEPAKNLQNFANPNLYHRFRRGHLRQRPERLLERAAAAAPREDGALARVVLTAAKGEARRRRARRGTGPGRSTSAIMRSWALIEAVL